MLRGVLSNTEVVCKEKKSQFGLNASLIVSAVESGITCRYMCLKFGQLYDQIRLYILLYYLCLTSLLPSSPHLHMYILFCCTTFD